uniref:Uncharacterized protein n=1 Tax=Anguilla anguilla TaxID=7936 RepID=A0A0E9WC67_ANGAN
MQHFGDGFYLDIYCITYFIFFIFACGFRRLRGKSYYERNSIFSLQS